MRILVTGATGFVGQAVVAAALDRGHQVVALTRSRRSVPPSWASVEVVENDLRRAGSWLPEVGRLDAIVHLAAGKFGDYHEQFAGTVVATERLLAALQPSPAGVGQVGRFVHVSSLAVYDYGALADNAMLTESSPTIDRLSGRDDYAQTKWLQEELVREWAALSSTDLVVLRPGAIYGPGELWDAGVGELVPPLRFALGSGVTRKFVFLDNCADAIVLAVERSEAVGRTINLIDDEQPTQREYRAALAARGLPAPRAIPVPYRLFRLGARVADLINDKRYHGTAKLPGLLSVSKLESRFKPLRYDNSLARNVLGWRPKYDLAAALDRCRG